MSEMDFPTNPTKGQKYTNSLGVVYEWNGYGWVIGWYDTTDQAFQSAGDLIDMIRTLLQDKDSSSGEYRYSTDSIVMNLNMGLIEMFRIRPDIFLANDFKIQQLAEAQPDTLLVIEQQYIPALVYYAVGLTQARDDEETQDQRAGSFLARFQQQLTGV